MRRVALLLLSLVFVIPLLAVDNIGNWDGSANSGSASGSAAHVTFTNASKNEVSLAVFRNHTFSWADSDTIVGDVAGYSGVFNVTDWKTDNALVFYKNKSDTSTNYDGYLETAPTDTGPWIEFIQWADSTASNTVQWDTLALSGAASFIRFKFVNDSSMLPHGSIDYLYLHLKRSERK